MEKYYSSDIGEESGKATIVKDTDVYRITDNTILSSMVLSKTVLYADKETRGHQHEQEEIYLFLTGIGKMTVGDETFDIRGGETVLVPSNKFHKVVNLGLCPFTFLCVFPGTRNH